MASSSSRENREVVEEHLCGQDDRQNEHVSPGAETPIQRQRTTGSQSGSVSNIDDKSCWQRPRAGTKFTTCSDTGRGNLSNLGWPAKSVNAYSSCQLSWRSFIANSFYAPIGELPFDTSTLRHVDTSFALRYVLEPILLYERAWVSSTCLCRNPREGHNIPTFNLRAGDNSWGPEEE